MPFVCNASSLHELRKHLMFTVTFSENLCFTEYCSIISINFKYIVLSIDCLYVDESALKTILKEL